VEVRPTQRQRAKLAAALRVVPWVLLVLVLAAGLTSARLAGDYSEYVLTARALAARGSPALEAADARWLATEDPRTRARSTDIAEQLEADASETVVGGIRRGLNGRYYAIHFWLYSLLLAPFLTLCHWMGSKPASAVAMTNAVALGIAFLYASRCYRHSWQAVAGLLLLLLSGATFYVGWCGPEALTGAMVFIAVLAARKGDFGISALSTGVAASQNPSAVFLFAFILGQLLLFNRTTGGRPGVASPRARTRDILLVAGGAMLALAPVVFFQSRFGVPSVIAAIATDTTLVGLERGFSLFFDINQGMLAGVPGLMVAFGVGLVAVWTSAQARRWRTLGDSLVVLVVVVGMAVPTLATHNFNADGVVFMRYAYWLAMPLAAELVTMIHRHDGWLLRAALVAGVAVQGGIVAFHGVTGSASSYVRHGSLATIALDHWPKLYDPVPEIFVERTLHHERQRPEDGPVAYPTARDATKILLHWTHVASFPDLCAGENDVVVGESVSRMERGFSYLNAPFGCRAVTPGSGQPWTPNAAHPEARAILGSGWSSPEPGGTWTDGAVSHLRLPVPPGARRIRMNGRYYERLRASEVVVDGSTVGSFDLSDADLVLPVASRTRSSVDVVLRHPGAQSPKALGRSDDPRNLGYFLMALKVE
jgi:hypothetical protein